MNSSIIFIDGTLTGTTSHGQGEPKRQTVESGKDLFREEARQQLHKNATSNIEQVLEAESNKAAVVRPPTTHHEYNPK